MSEMTLDEFNQLNTQARAALLHDCCHCQSWANTLAEAAPFSSVSELTQQATQLFAKASEAEILEAFQGHAKIGDIELLKSKYAGKAQNEQGQVLQANEQTIRELWQLNQDYEQNNGFIFIVCATGKSAEQMLSILKSRINNSREQELKNGANEQNKITELRLAQLFKTSG